MTRCTRRLTLLAMTGSLLVACGDDDGGNNQQVNNNNNAAAVCGNGVVETGEQCDDGAANDDTTPGACRTTCRTAHCGDGVLDAGEVCDGAALGGATCVGEGFTGGEIACTAACALDTAACTTCEDGVREGAEECDGADTGGESCLTLGLGQHGLLRCDAACAFDGSDCHDCGDGVLEPAEDCEPDLLETCAEAGYTGGSRQCSNTCDLIGACESLCGNGVLEPDEVCDGAELGSATCVGLGFHGGELTCSASCQLNTGGCSSCGDGAIDVAAGEQCDGAALGGATCASALGAGYSGTPGCTAGCRLDLTVCVAPAACGNGARDTLEGEQCDGAALGGYTCATWRPGVWGGGALTCRDNCTFDEAACVAANPCGNGVREAALGETCDGADLGGQTCSGLGFPGGSLACGSDCALDLSGCDPPVGCGDGDIGPGELCDGADLGDQTCDSAGFHGGTLACTRQCRLDTSACTNCGNGARDAGEVCDGLDLGNQTCGTQGFYGGTLACNATCSALVLTGCAGLCGDGVLNGPEVCDGADFGGDTCVARGFESGSLACVSACSAVDDSGCVMANRVPVAVADSVNATFQTATVVSVLANDSDPDSDPLTVTEVTQPAHGTAAISGGGQTVTYTPAAGYTGADSFTYTISDGHGHTATATVSVTVQVDATPPAAITNLAVSYSGVTDTVRLTWTATGDNGTTGTAAAYVVKVSAVPITPANFDLATTIAQAWTPLAAGQAETKTVPLTWHTGTWYLAIKARDAASNLSAVSNVVTANTAGSVTLPGATFDFGTLAYFRTAPHDFAVTNTSTLVDLVLSDVSLAAAAGYSLTSGAVSGPPVTLTPGQTHTAQVTFAPLAAATFTGTLTIAHDADSPASPRLVALTGVGQNAAPELVQAALDPEAVQAGTAVTLTASVSDGNNALPATNDLASVTADLSALGGSATQAMTYLGPLDGQTAMYSLSVPTTAAAAGAHAITVKATDGTGATAQTTVTLLVYTGSLLHVGAGQTYTTIQAGINAAANGDMVLVHDGTYTGAGNKSLVMNGKRIILTGQNGAAATIIDCQSSGRAFLMFNTAETRATVIRGFTMRNCTASAMRLVHDDGIAGHNPSPTISSCVFTSNTNSGNGGAIAMDGPDISVLIDGCTFTDNVVNVQPSLFNGGAISGENGATVEIQGSSFTGNTARYGDAVYLIDSGDWAIRGSTFLGNGIAGTDAYAVYSMNGDLGVIEDCLFDANQNAIKASDSVFALRRTTVQGCLGATFSENSVELQGPGPWQVVTVTDCNFYNNAAAGHTLSLGQGSSTVERCTFNSNSGVAVAGYGDLVSIRNSVFTLNQGAVYFNGKRLELESSEITGSHFYGSYPNVIGYHGNSIRMVDNLVQSNSMLYSSPLYIQFNEGTDSRPSLISGNHIEDNSTSQDYGLLHINLNFSPYEIPVRNNVFSNNVNQGNGIINVYRWSETTGWVNFRDNLVHGNQAVDGGGLYVNGHTTASHTIRVHNCTITGNTASRAGGGIHVNEGKVEIKNSIIWGNTDGNSGVDSGDNLYVNQVSAPVVNVDNCDIGSAAGQIYDPSMIINTPNGFLSGTRGNLSADPLFVTGPDGVYYLSHVAAGQASTSPCVNAGSTTAAALGLDLWTTRTDGVTDSGTVDLGYHYIP